MKSDHTSYLEISKSALQQNLKFLKDLMGKEVLISSVIKGNAYGHGIEQFVPFAENCGINHFSVFSADEAMRVKKFSLKNSTIMIMGLVKENQLKWAIQNNIEFYVFEMNRLKQALRISKKLNIQAKIHVEVETGMNRTGFPLKELPTVLEIIKSNPTHLHFQGLCTHFAGAESIANYVRIKKQQQNYLKAVKIVEKHGLKPQQKHTSCSAAALRYPKFRMDMVRLGIIQYGFFPNKEVLIEYLTKKKVTENPLKRLISWKSCVMDVKNVKMGEFIGYGNSYQANSAKKIAIIPVGYCHGFSRTLSNQGRVLINGQSARVIGNVNMNMATVDVSNIENVSKGDEVVLIGKQGDLEISVASFSEFSDLVNYELLIRLPESLPKFIVD